MDCAIDYASKRLAFNAPILKMQTIQVRESSSLKAVYIETDNDNIFMMFVVFKKLDPASDNFYFSKACLLLLLLIYYYYY